MAIGIQVTVSGPVGKGQWRAKAHRAVAAGLEAAEHELLQAAFDDINVTLNRVLRKQTPHFRLQTKIVSNRVENNVIYGPWLEGTGSRNRTTRFKGYFTFRKVASRIRSKKDYVTERNIRQALRRAGV
jgi:hypothetical protein